MSLTLTAEPAVIDGARSYAERSGMTLEAFVLAFLESVAFLESIEKRERERLRPAAFFADDRFPPQKPDGARERRLRRVARDTSPPRAGRNQETKRTEATSRNTPLASLSSFFASARFRHSPILRFMSGVSCPGVAFRPRDIGRETRKSQPIYEQLSIANYQIVNNCQLRILNNENLYCSPIDNYPKKRS